MAAKSIGRRVGLAVGGAAVLGAALAGLVFVLDYVVFPSGSSPPEANLFLPWAVALPFVILIALAAGFGIFALTGRNKETTQV